MSSREIDVAHKGKTYRVTFNHDGEAVYVHVWNKQFGRNPHWLLIWATWKGAQGRVIKGAVAAAKELLTPGA